jgi:2-polyprenyl-3-methyl-5-hydroxy-6-metoxy-1,4-benzoquinol methylase
MSQLVKKYYDKHATQEWERLDDAQCKIEFASTLHLIEKYFPKQGRVCDIGGGPGRYTIELAKRGYRVTLFDISEEEIKLARTHLKQSGLEAEQLVIGDALYLNQYDLGLFDAALLMGPMYHVIDASERQDILRQLKDMLKPKGVAIVAYLNSWGLIRTGIVDFPHWYKDISKPRSMLHESIFEGQALSNFTECYWSTPEAALREVREAGFEVISYAGAEGFASGMKPLLEKLRAEIPEAYANVVQFSAETCELSQYRDSTDHLHFVVQRSVK